MTASNADWWRGCAIYQVYPRSFQDSTGDGIGDLNGIARRLDHIASLGVDAVWLSPFFKSPMADMGYDVSDYRDVDPMFGTLADFDRLVEAAHALGLKIIIDQVLSHTSDQHPWFRESRTSRDNPKADWYVWADAKPDGTPPNNWLSLFGGSAWEWESVRKQYYMHNFLASQPDLNFHNPDVQDALLSAVRFWLERGVDGFRLDTVNFYFHDRALRSNPPLSLRARAAVADVNPYEYQDHVFDKTRPENLDFLRRLRALLDEYGDRTTVGEIGDGARSLQTVAAYTSGGDKLDMSYTFDLLGPYFSAAHVHRSIRAFEAAVTDGWICWAFSNHDVERHVSRWTPVGGDTDRTARFTVALLSCLRGSICLYEGEELGLEEARLRYEDLRDPYGIRFWPGYKGRDGCRTPMVWEAGARNAGFSTGRPWLPVPREHRARAVDLQNRDPGSILARYRETLAFRKSHPALVMGAIELIPVREGVLAFLRRDGADTLFCAFNFRHEALAYALPRRISRLAPLDFPGAEGALRGRTLDLPPLGFFVGRAG